MPTIKLFGFQLSIGRITTQAKTGTVADIHDTSLVERAVRNAKPDGLGDAERWVAVRDSFGLGSTYATQLCRRFNLNPYDQVRGTHCPECDQAEISAIRTQLREDGFSVLNAYGEEHDDIYKHAAKAWRTAINLRKAEGDWEESEDE